MERVDMALDDIVKQSAKENQRAAAAAKKARAATAQKKAAPKKAAAKAAPQKQVPPAKKKTPQKKAPQKKTPLAKKKTPQKKGTPATAAPGRKRPAPVAQKLKVQKGGVAKAKAKAGKKRASVSQRTVTTPTSLKVTLSNRASPARPGALRGGVRMPVGGARVQPKAKFLPKKKPAAKPAKRNPLYVKQRLG